MDQTKRYKETQVDHYDALKLDLNALPNEPQIDRLLNKYIHSLGGYLTDHEARSRVPGAAVLVRKDNDIVHMNCYGYSNIETREKITPATVFDLGSLSKQFTAMAVLGLHIAKYINVEKDTLSKFFDRFPLYADKVTIQELIHHTSALPEYIDIQVQSRRIAEKFYTTAMEKRDDFYPQMARRKAKELTNKDVVRWIASQKLLPREPDTEFSYSNSGYVLLAELVERVAEMPFADYLKEQIFKAVGMDDTYVLDETCAFAKDAPEVVHHAKCYNRVKGEGFVPVGYTPLNFINGDGNVQSTIVDLAKWDLHLHRLDYTMICTRHDPQKQAARRLRDLLWEPIQTKNHKRVNYGAGWNLFRSKYEREIEENGQRVTKKYESRGEYHRGEWLAWRSYIARASRWQVPDQGWNIAPDKMESLGIVILTNNNQFKIRKVANQISQLYWGPHKKDNIMNTFD